MRQTTVLLCLLCLLLIRANAQEKIIYNKKENGFPFKVKHDVQASAVKNQYHSGTCWSFSSQSFLESEIVTHGGEPTELSEMYVVRNMYLLKARRYVRMQGKTNFGAGGELPDAIRCMTEFGLVPREVYTGNPEPDGKPRHGEMDAVLNAMLNEVIKLHDGKISPNWEKAFTAVLDAYLGKVPENFTYRGKSYTPASFAASLPIKASDYVTLTSFTHHPFYQNFVLEIPDNWAVDAYTNVTLDELEATIDNALANGYTVGWASDVSEKGFSYKNGLAIVPEKNWDDMTKGEKDSIFLHPVKQKQITQALRQEAFDNLTTTDDHGMHITGSCTDSLGQKFYIVKNSWGSEDSDLKGYFLASAAFIRYKTTNILVHKDAIPAELRKKIGR